MQPLLSGLELKERTRDVVGGDLKIRISIAYVSAMFQGEAR